MKFIIKESQYLLFIEQFDPEDEKLYPSSKPTKAQQKNREEYGYEGGIKNEPTDVSWEGFYNPKDKHTILSILQFGSAFIPFAGPFISAGIGLYDAKTYYDEGDKTNAGIVGVLSMLPFLGKIPVVKQVTQKIGTKGMSLLMGKLSKGGANLTKAELEIANVIKNYTPQIQEELSKMGPKLKGVVKELDLYKANYIKKYGENEYNTLITKYLYDGIDKNTFIKTLKNVKDVNIRIKPILGGGQDHRVYQIISNPNQILKVEIRPGQVEQWYNTFKKNPDFFPKIFRKTKVKGQDGKLLDAVILEKLNTKPFMDLWGKLESSLHKSQRLLPHNEQTVNLEYMLKRLKTYPHLNKKWSNLIKTIKSESPELSGKVDEFDKIINRWYEITPNPDIRKFNLGYDENDILKVLDI